MSQIYLYPKVVVKGQDFSKEKVVTQPNQCLTLQQIIDRFIRKEPLPLMKEGIYEERMGDLEKIAHEDITVRKERAAALKVKLTKYQERIEKEGKESPSSVPTPLSGTAPIVGAASSPGAQSVTEPPKGS